MKKILSLLGTITLIGTSTTSLIACNTTQYSEEELKQEKEKHNLNINGNILEWIVSKEKPFNQIDDKWYFVVWRSDTNNNWRIIKFLNDTNNKKVLDNYGRYKLIFKEYSPFFDFTLLIRGERGDADHTWKGDNGKYFKSVYCWNDDSEPNIAVENKLKSYLGL